MPHPEAESPSPHPYGRPDDHGVTAVWKALEPFVFPMDASELASCGGDRTFSYRHGQALRLGDVMALLPPRRFESIEEAVAAIVGALDERRGADRRVAPPRIGAADRMPY